MHGQELVARILLSIFVLASWGVTNSESHNALSNAFDVTKYGAVGDGKTDDSQAFLKAWKDVCQATNQPILSLPRGRNFLLKPVDFQGPCKSSSVTIQVDGNIVAPNRISAWKGHDLVTWLRIAYVDGLIIKGSGQIDGRGAIWWKLAEKLPSRPTALGIAFCKNLQLDGLRHINSPGAHISLIGVDGSTISNLHINAPPTSPNTDGIDIGISNNVQIRGCIIATGDDCIAVGNGTKFLNVTDVACGPGHGISIGSLGKNGATDVVEEIHVKNCSFKGTSNGLRIKTWQGGHGYARKISYEKITLDAVDNPIIIDQFYCIDQLQKCNNQTSGVQVSDVTYNNVHGTSSTDDAISLKCSRSIGCTGIFLTDINITSSTPGKTVKSTCINAHGKHTGTTIPRIDCLQA